MWVQLVVCLRTFETQKYVQWKEISIAPFFTPKDYQRDMQKVSNHRNVHHKKKSKQIDVLHLSERNAFLVNDGSMRSNVMITVAIFQYPVRRRFCWLLVVVRHCVNVYHDAITCFAQIVCWFGEVFAEICGSRAIQRYSYGAVALGVYFWGVEQVFLWKKFLLNAIRIIIFVLFEIKQNFYTLWIWVLSFFSLNFYSSQKTVVLTRKLFATQFSSFSW